MPKSGNALFRGRFFDSEQLGRSLKVCDQYFSQESSQKKFLQSHPSDPQQKKIFCGQIRTFLGTFGKKIHCFRLFLTIAYIPKKKP